MHFEILYLNWIYDEIHFTKINSQLRKIKKKVKMTAQNIFKNKYSCTYCVGVNQIIGNTSFRNICKILIKMGIFYDLQ